MSRNLVAEILDLTIRQGFDVKFADGEYFIITLYKEDCCRELMIDIDDLRSETIYSIEDYIVKVLEKARGEIITEIEKGKRKEE